MAIWMSWNTDIPWSLNSSDTFPRRKFKNRAPTSCRSGPILSMSTISFELHVKVAEEIDLEMCIYGQLSEVQMVRVIDLGLGSGQGHSTCRTTNLPKHVTVVSRKTEIRPFKFRKILTIGEVWTLVIAFLGGNSKIGLRQAVDQVPYYDYQPSVLTELRAKVAEEMAVEMCSYGQLSEVQMLHDLDFDLGSGQGHINIQYV